MKCGMRYALQGYGTSLKAGMTAQLKPKATVTNVVAFPAGVKIFNILCRLHLVDCPSKVDSNTYAS